MEFLFQITDYNDPALDAEAAELFCRRLEAKSREVLPGMWRVTDRLNAQAAKGPGRETRRRRYRVYGALLMVLGVFALVPGLMEPRIPSLIAAGGFAAVIGLWNLGLRERKPFRPTTFCRKEAAELLKACRETDWKALRAEVRFDADGWSVRTTEGEIRTEFDKLQSVFETERLWLLACEKDRALLLQKKDLSLGGAEEFLPHLREKIHNKAYQ